MLLKKEGLGSRGRRGGISGRARSLPEVVSSEYNLHGEYPTYIWISRLLGLHFEGGGIFGAVSGLRWTGRDTGWRLSRLVCKRGAVRRLFL